MSAPASSHRIVAAIVATVLAAMVVRSHVRAQQPAAVEQPSALLGLQQPTAEQEANCFGDARGPRERHYRTGAFRFIGSAPGRRLRINPRGAAARPQDAARDYLANCAALFGAANPDRDLTAFESRQSADGRSHVRFQQLHRGIPVMGGELVLNLDSSNRMLSAGGEILPAPPVDTIPSVAANAAATTARLAVAAAYNVDPAQLSTAPPALWVYSPTLVGAIEGPAALVWRLEVRGPEPVVVRDEVLVGAVTGTVVVRFSKIETARNRQTYTANNTSSLPGTLVCNESNPTCSGGDTDAVSAHRYAADTYDFYQANHARDSIDNAGMTLRSTVHYGSGYVNAFWNGTLMVYGDGAGFARADDVVGHELTHGVTEYTSNLIYMNQSGAINESMSDIFGEFVDQSNGRGDDSPAVKWLMGEDVTGLGAIRSMSNPTSFGDPDRMGSPSWYSGSNQSIFVHSNSGVGNKAAFLITDGGIFNGQTITGLGLTKTAKIYYEVQTHLLTSGADYADLGDALVQGCNNLVGTAGISLADCAEVQKATIAVEMHAAIDTCASVVTTTLTTAAVSPVASYTFTVGDGAAGSSTPGATTTSQMRQVQTATVGNRIAGTAASFQDTQAATGLGPSRQVDRRVAEIMRLSPRVIQARPLTEQDRLYPLSTALAGRPAAQAGMMTAAEWPSLAGVLAAPTILAQSNDGAAAVTAFDLSFDDTADAAHVCSLQLAMDFLDVDSRELTVWLTAGDRDVLLWDGAAVADPPESRMFSIDRILDAEMSDIRIDGAWTLFVQNRSTSTAPRLEHAHTLIVGRPAIDGGGAPAPSAGPSDLAAVKTYFRTGPGGSGALMQTPTVGQSLYFYGDYVITGTGGDVTYSVRLALDGVEACSGTFTRAPDSTLFFWCGTPWLATAGSHTVTLEVDYTNTVDEISEANNSASRTVTSGSASGVDFIASAVFMRTPAPGGVYVPAPSAGQSVQPWGQYEITGANDSYTQVVRMFLDGVEWCNGMNITTIGVTEIPCAPWTATVGTHTLTFRVDDSHLHTENDETNNAVSYSFTVSGLDVAADTAYLRTAPAGGGDVITLPLAGQTVYFHGDYRIVGSGTDVTVSSRLLLDGSPMCSETFTGAPGTSRTMHCASGYAVAPGISHTLMLEVDYANAVAESNESNNTATRFFNSGPGSTIDLEATSTFLRRQAGGVVTAPIVGQVVFFNGAYSILGSGANVTYGLRLVLDGSTFCSGSFTESPGTSWIAECVTGWTATAGSHTLVFEIDYADAVAELNEVNNSASAAFTSVSPSLDIEALTTSMRTAANGGGAAIATGTIGQTVYFHLGWQVTGSGAGVTTTQRVLIDGEIFCKCSTTGMPGTTYRSSCSQGWVVTPGNHTITWELDYGHIVDESNEINNTSTHSFTSALLPMRPAGLRIQPVPPP